MQKPGWVVWTAILDLSPSRMCAMRVLPWTWSVLAVNQPGRFGGCFFVEVTLGWMSCHTLQQIDLSWIPLNQIGHSKNFEHVEPETGICFSEIIMMQPFFSGVVGIYLPLFSLNITKMQHNMYGWLSSLAAILYPWFCRHVFFSPKSELALEQKNWFLEALAKTWSFDIPSWKLTYPLKRQIWR